ncbi:MAG: aldose 1-epimerase family protein [Acidobacteria bacterium]|nr:aldose 1-epimerase family protein [Acidobacteriota bacterium]
MQVWGNKWTSKQLLERTGALSQLGGIVQSEYVTGKAKGVNALRVRTATGLEFSVLPDKGLDIVEASYRGNSLAWHSPVGIVHPAYYDPRKIEWLKTFPGGLLCTCGMTNAGFPDEDMGEELGLHGAVSNIPAEHVHWTEEWQDDDCWLRITGKVREARVHGPNLLLRRTVHASLLRSMIRVEDVVENQGFLDTPLMYIYHLNFGFPLLTEFSRIYAPSLAVTGRNQHSTASLDKWAEFEPPTLGIGERVYYHDMRPDPDGKVTIVLLSDDRSKDFGISVRYSAASMPRFIQWKMTGVNHFVLGLEPANCRVEGRAAERKAGTLKTLKPGEQERFGFEMHILDGKQEVQEAIAKIEIAR